MRRVTIEPRPDWKAKVEQWGMLFHTTGDAPYWFEGAYYEFTAAQIDQLEEATGELHRLCLTAVDYVVSHKLYSRLGISEFAGQLIDRSWRRRDPSLYGRFDLAYDGVNPPKMLEYNADTPTALLEAAVIQWHWLEELFPDADQFNSIWEGLVAQWKAMAVSLPSKTAYFASVDSLEDDMTVTMLCDTAMEAGLAGEYIDLKAVGWHPHLNAFVDMQERPIQTLFKLYPWEWLAAEPFAQHIPACELGMRWLEPVWKLVLSSKGILTILWELNPNHPLLLEAYLGSSGPMTSYVKKPLFGREGANVTIMEGGVLEQSDGEYGAEGFVFQRLQPIPNLGGNHPVVGSWICGDEPHGIGIRESDGLITNNVSRFVPHLFR